MLHMFSVYACFKVISTHVYANDIHMHILQNVLIAI